MHSKAAVIIILDWYIIWVSIIVLGWSTSMLYEYVIYVIYTYLVALMYISASVLKWYTSYMLGGG